MFFIIPKTSSCEQEHNKFWEIVKLPGRPRCRAETAANETSSKNYFTLA